MRVGERLLSLAKRVEQGVDKRARDRGRLEEFLTCGVRNQDDHGVGQASKEFVPGDWKQDGAGTCKSQHGRALRFRPWADDLDDACLDYKELRGREVVRLERQADAELDARTTPEHLP